MVRDAVEVPVIGIGAGPHVDGQILVLYDMLGITQGRLPPRGEADDHFYAGAPDLAVEVLSPSDRWPAVGKKVMQYLDAGAREVWVVDPKKRRIHTYAGSPPTSRIVDGDGPLTSPLLPGFALPLVELFD